MLDLFRSIAVRRKYVLREKSGEALAQRTKGARSNNEDELGKHQLPLSLRPVERAASEQPSGGGTTPDFSEHPSGVVGPHSPGATATAASSPAAQSGTGEYPTSSLLERREASPATERCARGHRHSVIFSWIPAPFR